jgi:multidrug efflux pump subunit AcrB
MEALIFNILHSTWRKRFVIAIVLAALGGSVMMIPTKLVLAKMLPGKSANTFTIYVDTPTNSSMHQTESVSQCIVDFLKKEKEIMDMEIYLGQGAPLDYAGLVKGSDFKSLKYQSEIVVNLTDKHGRDEPSFSMVHRIRPQIKAQCVNVVPGTTIKFIEMPSGPPTLATIVIELFGKDDVLMRRTAETIAKVLEQTEGLVDIDVMQDTVFMKFELLPDKEKILRSALSVEQVNNIIYLAFKGVPIAVKNTRDQQDQVPIFVRLSEHSHRFESNSKEALEEKLSSLKLMNQQGMMIPLREVVDVAQIPSSPTIFRKNLKNMVTITAECDMVSQVYPLLEAREALQKALNHDFNVTKIPGISTYMFDLNLQSRNNAQTLLLRWDGEMKVSLDTFRDLGGAFIAALVLMFLLMVVYYKSFALSGIVLAGSFLSIIGVIAGHWVTDKIQLFFTDTNFFLTATSLIGFISLMGISARSSLLLIDFSRSLIAKGIDKKVAISVATATRAKPIMLTAVAIILGSLLLATDPIFGGLGVALIFGSIAATLVSLFFIPVLMDSTEAMCWLEADAT